MKIAFNGFKCGWGNNGGTQSIFRMAEALANLGHEVQLWSHVPNKFTWFKLSPSVSHLELKSLSKAPSVDVLINSSCRTTLATHKFKRKKVGVQWLRAHEDWLMPEAKLFELYKLGMPLWANSEWMKVMIEKKFDRKVDVQYCGVPMEQFYRCGSWTLSNDKFTIGALCSTKPRKRFDDIKAVMGKVKAHYLFFGNERTELGESYVRPSLERKRVIYSRCHVWLALSEPEGLHIPPMEAALCGAAVAGNKCLPAGNMDYCIQNKTAIRFKSGSIKEIVAAIEYFRSNPVERLRMNENMKSLIRSKIGDVETNAKLFIKRLKNVGI